jgi:hypothetical protein
VFYIILKLSEMMIMYRFVNNAIVFLGTAVILILCIGSYLGADTFSDMSKAAVEALPFGAYLWEAYTVIFDPSYAQNATQTLAQSISLKILDYVGEFAKLMISWFKYICQIVTTYDLLKLDFS